MKKNNILKSGFTLVELMVFFVFLSLVIAASTPIITKKVKNIPIKMHHGKYLCVPDGEGVDENGNPIPLYRQEYYNSTRRTSSETGLTACTFKPPKRATLFKIEMIGAGAGGYALNAPVKIEEEDPKSATYGYNYTGQKWLSDGDGIKELTAAEKKSVFMNADFLISRGVKKGGEGNVAKVPSYPLLDSFTLVNLKNKEEDLSATAQEVRTALATDLQAGCSEKTGHIWCKPLPNENLEKKIKEKALELLPALESIDNIRINYTYQSEDSWENTAYGGIAMGSEVFYDCWSDYCYHTNPTYLYVQGKMDFKNYQVDPAEDIGFGEDAINNYFNKIFTEYYVPGRATGKGNANGDCIGFSPFSTDYILNYHDARDVNSDTKNNELRFDTEKGDDGKRIIEGKWGQDVIHYDAIRVWGKCTTNAVRGKGSQGGYVETDGDSYILYSRGSGFYYDADGEPTDYRGRDRGTPPSGTAGKSGSIYPVNVDDQELYKQTKYPYASIKTQLNKRIHEVGVGGKAGEYKTFYVPNIGDDCTLHPALGGRVIESTTSDEMIENYENSLRTSLVCNEGRLNLSVSGGTYDKSTIRKEYSTLEYLNADGTVVPKENRKPFITPDPNASEEDGNDGKGEPSKFVRNDIFTKFVLHLDSDIGAGGRGDIVEDACNMPKGYYNVSLIRIDSTEVPRITKGNFKDVEECHEETAITRTNAERGKSGAIIITW